MKLLGVLSLVLLLTVCLGQQCPSGYNCSSCSDSQCSACTTDLTICDTCNTGYYNLANVCTACPTKCLTCATNTYCDKCTPGYEREYDGDGNQICVFYWWKWFLIVFGVLLGVVLLGGAIWWVRNKLKEEENVKEVNYQIKTKHQNTESNIKD